MERDKLTKSLVEGIKAESKDIIVQDREVKDFGLKVTPTGRLRSGKMARRKRARYRGRCIVKGGPGVANRVVSLL